MFSQDDPLKCDWPGCEDANPHFHFSKIQDRNSWDVKEERINKMSGCHPPESIENKIEQNYDQNLYVGIPGAVLFNKDEGPRWCFCKIENCTMPCPAHPKETLEFPTSGPKWASEEERMKQHTQVLKADITYIEKAMKAFEDRLYALTEMYKHISSIVGGLQEHHVRQIDENRKVSNIMDNVCNTLDSFENTIGDGKNDRGNITTRLEYLENFEQSLVKAQHPKLLQDRINKIEEWIEFRKLDDKEGLRLYKDLRNRIEKIDSIRDSRTANEDTTYVCHFCHTNVLRIGGNDIKPLKALRILCEKCFNNLCENAGMDK